MDSISLIAVATVLLIILVVLVLVFVLKQNRAEPAAAAAPKPDTSAPAPEASFEQLAAVIKNKHSTASQLKEATEKIVSRYGRIEKKLGLRPHPHFDRYKEAIFSLCRHPNVTKEIIITFDKGLSSLNGEYRQEIDEALKQGLSSRGM